MGPPTLRPTEDAAPFEPGAAFEDHGAGSALASLPERLVLWHLDVEGESPSEVAYLGPLPVPVATVASRGDGRSVVSRFRAAVPGRAGGAMTATAVTLAGTGTSHRRLPAGHASSIPRPAAAPSSRSHPKPSPNPATADVAVTARSTSTVPHSYDVDSTLSGVPAGRTTSLVVQGFQGMTLSSNDMSCTGGGSSRLSCTVGSGTIRASFSVVNLGVDAGQVTLTIGPVEGFATPLTATTRPP